MIISVIRNVIQELDYKLSTLSSVVTLIFVERVDQEVDIAPVAVLGDWGGREREGEGKKEEKDSLHSSASFLPFPHLFPESHHIG